MKRIVSASIILIGLFTAIGAVADLEDVVVDETARKPSVSAVSSKSRKVEGASYVVRSGETPPPPPPRVPKPTIVKVRDGVPSLFAPRASFPVRSSHAERPELNEILDDLDVMSEIFRKRLGAEETRPLLAEDPVRSFYLEGRGPVFIVHVRMPLQPAAQAQNPERKTDEVWIQTLREMRGVTGLFPNELPYDGEKVEALTASLFATIRHASNIRHLAPEETITMLVIGPPSLPVDVPVTALLPFSILTIYVSKKDVDRLAAGQLSVEELRRQTSVYVEPGEKTDLPEDIEVMSRILDKNLRALLGTDYGLPDPFRAFWDPRASASQRPQGLYFPGYGVLFLINLKIQVAGNAAVSGEGAAESTDLWEQTRRELAQHSQGAQTPLSPSVEAYGLGGQPLSSTYDAERVEQLKTQLVKTMRYAANIRAVPSNEAIVFVALGPGAPSGGFFVVSTAPTEDSPSTFRKRFSLVGGMNYPATSLTFYAKKADIDTFANGEIDFDAFLNRVTISTYVSSADGSE